jgi:hypothetical protein
MTARTNNASPREKTMEEYECMTANTLETWHTIVDAIFRGDCEIKRSVASLDLDKDGKFAIYVVWDRAAHVLNGREYRWKKPAPPKVKKLVDRTPEDMLLLIGKYVMRFTSREGGTRLILSNDVPSFQNEREIAPIGTEDWKPMQKEIEVVG